MSKRVIVYVDGQNFYHGLRSVGWKKYYWLNLISLFEKFIKSYQILVEVNYFTCAPSDKEKVLRQNLFIAANQTSPRFKLHWGSLIERKLQCRKCNFKYTYFEEKESDVRIATQLVSDAIADKCDVSILVTGDSDLVPGIEVIQKLKPQHKISILFPPGRISSRLGQISNHYSKLERHEQKFENSLFPQELLHPKTGQKLEKPIKWR